MFLTVLPPNFVICNWIKCKKKCYAVVVSFILKYTLVFVYFNILDSFSLWHSSPPVGGAIYYFIETCLKMPKNFFFLGLRPVHKVNPKYPDKEKVHLERNKYPRVAACGTLKHLHTDTIYNLTYMLPYIWSSAARTVISGVKNLSPSARLFGRTFQTRHPNIEICTQTDMYILQPTWSTHARLWVRF